MSRDCLASQPSAGTRWPACFARLLFCFLCFHDALLPRALGKQQPDECPQTLLVLQASSSLCIAICLPDCGICQPVSGLHCCLERPKLTLRLRSFHLQNPHRIPAHH